MRLPSSSVDYYSWKMKTVYCIFLLLALCSAKPFSEEEFDDRIVGGVQTDITVHPYLVSLRKRNVDASEKDFTHTCGGSIYDEWTIITAGHCVIGKIPSLLKVVAGSNYRQGVSGVIVNVAEIIFHENYDPYTLDYDAAILILASPLPLNNFTMKPIELTDTEYPAGKLASLSGWGTIRSQGSSPYVLRSVELPLVDRETCQQDYLRTQDLVTERMICAGYRGVGGKDTCQGDSGGPLVVENKLAGIVSWGRGCGLPEYPGAYTNVKYFVPWFTEQIAEAKIRNNIV